MRALPPTDVLVVGGGPAGLAAAASAAEAGARVTLVERDTRFGGVLGQCVHDGFGLERYGESLTGPEFAGRLDQRVRSLPIERLAGTHVLSVGSEGARLLSADGYRFLPARASVLAMGCRERPFGSLRIASSRPAGVFSAGCAQRLVNVEGLTLGRRVVVLGSGDVGLIMARRMVLEGAEVACVVERLPFPGGLPRNVSQCLNDFGIPLLLRHTVVEVLGRRRVTGVVVAEVDECGKPVEGTQAEYEADTLLVSVGLVPEAELARTSGASIDNLTCGPVVDQTLMTSLPGVFACGNVLHVHDLADAASTEGEAAGLAAASAPRGEGLAAIAVSTSSELRYVVPQRLRPGLPARLSFRVREPMRRASVSVTADGEEIAVKGFAYLAPSEMACVEVPALPQDTRGVRIEVIAK